MDKQHREALAAVRDEVGRRAHVTIQRGSKHYQILMSDGPTGEGEIGRITLGTGPRVAMHARAEARRLMKVWVRPLPGAEVTKVWVDEARYMADHQRTQVPKSTRMFLDGKMVGEVKPTFYDPQALRDARSPQVEAIVQSMRGKSRLAASLGTTAIATGAVYDRRQYHGILEGDSLVEQTGPDRVDFENGSTMRFAKSDETLHGIGYEVDRQYRVGEREIQDLLSKVDYSGIEERVRAWAESASPEELARWLEGDFTPYLPETTVSGGGTQAPEETAMDTPTTEPVRSRRATGKVNKLTFKQLIVVSDALRDHVANGRLSIHGTECLWEDGLSDTAVAQAISTAHGFLCSVHSVALVRKQVYGNLVRQGSEPRSTDAALTARVERLERALRHLALSLGDEVLLAELDPDA